MERQAVSGSLFAALLAVLAVVAGCAPGQEQRYVALLAEQYARYPQMQIQDVYKFAHQASLGNAHFAADEARAAKYLLSELHALRGEGSDPLCEPLEPSGRVVRLHLRPYGRSGGLPEDLVTAMLQTAHSFESSTKRLERYWAYAEAAAAKGALPFPVEEMRAYFSARADEGHPAVDHSQRFLMVYRPAYRVVMRRHLPVSC